MVQNLSIVTVKIREIISRYSPEIVYINGGNPQK